MTPKGEWLRAKRAKERATRATDNVKQPEYEKGITYTATAPYDEKFIVDPKGTYFMQGDKTRTRYRREVTPAENKKGYLAVRKAEEGSLVTVHYPEYGDFAAHDEYYVITRGATLYSQPQKKKLLLEFRGSTLPDNQSIRLPGFRNQWLYGSTKEIASFLGMSDRIIVSAPRVKAKSYEEQLREWRKGF